MAKNIERESKKNVIQNSFDEALGTLKSGLDKVSEFGSHTKDKTIDFVESIVKLIPIIEKAGYRTNRFIVGVSIPPSVQLHLHRFKEVSEADIAALKSEYENKKILKMILSSLITVNNLQGKLNVGDLVFSEVALDITLPPKISIRYLNKEIAKLEKKIDLFSE
ncbi:hypothetical protein MHTCC0001_13900 [Flavobacteriaceae bacterium MHTCC 0001]